MRTLVLLTIVCGLATAQKQDQEEALPVFKAPVTNILAPVKVFDRKGTFVTGIPAAQFHLFDNGKEQQIQVDESLSPISLVIAIQCNHEVEQILPNVNHMGNLVGPLILGTRGEAAVVAFDSRVRVMQDFTSDPDLITEAVRKIHAGSLASRLTDAVDQAEHMLRNRPKDHQKVVLLISESRDEGSDNRGYETLDFLQANNVAVYIVTMSRVLGKLTAAPMDPDPDIMPPATYYLPPIVPATPTTLEHTYGGRGNSAEFVPLIAEIFKDAKAFVKAPAADVFAKGTGGTKYDFYKGRGLQDAIQDMATELHLQYMVSYSPNNKDEGGWHDIRVTLDGHEQAKVRSRPGYWMAAEVR